MPRKAHSFLAVPAWYADAGADDPQPRAGPIPNFGWGDDLHPGRARRCCGSAGKIPVIPGSRPPTIPVLYYRRDLFPSNSSWSGPKDLGGTSATAAKTIFEGTNQAGSTASSLRGQGRGRRPSMFGSGSCMISARRWTDPKTGDITFQHARGPGRVSSGGARSCGITAPPGFGE